MIKTLILSDVLFGSETWTMRKEDVKRLEACEMWIWRRMEKISWTEHITNEEVLAGIGDERAMIHTIKKRQRNWIGHILRRFAKEQLLKEKWRERKQEEDQDRRCWTG